MATPIIHERGDCKVDFMGACVKNDNSFHFPALYFHIPFCVSKCHYCDFNSWAWGKNSIPEEKYIEALTREIKRWRRYLVYPEVGSVNSIYFGGGTPSLFSSEGIGRILEQATSLASYSSAEITLELNPKTADLAKMEAFRQAGVNRLSMGIQTLEPSILKDLGRAHSADEALQALEWAFAARFDRINADLMYGLPGQTIEMVDQTLARLEPFSLQHLSAYELIVEEETLFANRSQTGRLMLPPSEEVLAMQRRINRFAQNKGMRHYEISNYARLGHESVHNLSYWNYRSFLGLGAGAVSFLRVSELTPDFWRDIGRTPSSNLYGVRLTNPKGLQAYLDESAEMAGVEVEEISLETAMAEFLMMGLRKSSGIRYAEFVECFDQEFPLAFREIVACAAERGWIRHSLEDFYFTEEGWLWSNEVLSDFIRDIDRIEEGR